MQDLRMCGLFELKALPHQVDSNDEGTGCRN